MYRTSSAFRRYLGSAAHCRSVRVDERSLASVSVRFVAVSRYTLREVVFLRDELGRDGVSRDGVRCDGMGGDDARCRTVGRVDVRCDSVRRPNAACRLDLCGAIFNTTVLLCGFDVADGGCLGEMAYMRSPLRRNHIPAFFLSSLAPLR